MLNKKEIHGSLLHALELAVLSSDTKSQKYNGVIQVVGNIQLAREIHEKSASLSRDEKNKAKDKLEDNRVALEKLLKAEESYSALVEDPATKAQARREVASLKEELAYIESAIQEIDQPEEFNPVKYLKQLYDGPELAALFRSGFDLAVLISSQGAASQKALISLFSKDWLDKNIKDAFELSKLLSQLLLDNQRGLLRKLDLGKFIKNNDFTVVLSGVGNKNQLEAFLREELKRQANLQEAANPALALPAKLNRVQRSMLFPSSPELQSRPPGGGASAETLNRIIKNADNPSQVASSSASLESLLPQQPKEKGPQRR